MATLNPFASFAQGQQLGMQRRAEERLIEDRERQEQSRNRMSALLAGGLPTTPQAQQSFVAQAAQADPGMALDWAQHFAKQQPDLLARRKQEAPFVTAELGNVTDQASYDMARQRLSDLGVDVDDMPDIYNPQQTNMVLQASRYLAEGAPEASTGPFTGSSLQGQAANILLSADPASPEYAAAYGIMSQPRTYLDQGSGQMVSIAPDMSAYAAPAGRTAQRVAKEPEPPMGVGGQPAPTVKQKETAQAGPGVTVTPIPSSMPKLTEGQKARDKEFGKEYVRWSGGGQADAERNIAQLEQQIQRLQGEENLTGPIIGMQPRYMATFTNPAGVDVQEQVEEVVQRNLREILGAQFTEREGERLISRAYNPRLEETVNVARLTRLVDQMRRAADAKNAMAQYFDQYGTLQGYKGPKMPTMSEMGDAVEGEGEIAQPTTKEERDALPSGTPYIAPDGSRKVKK